MREVQKDPIRAKRLNEVYKHLFAHFGITSQKHLAEVLKVQRTGLSSAFNGNVTNLTDNLFKKICAAFPGVFNLDYLLTGEGSLLTIEEEVHNEEYEKLYNPQPIDQSSLVNAALAAKDEMIEELRSHIADLKATIADKDAIIKDREARIVALERQLAAAATSDLSHYPFSFGAADGHDRQDVSPNP